MKTLKIDGEKYHLPESWAELTFRQWYAAQKADGRIGAVAALTGVPAHTLSQMEYGFVVGLYNQFSWMDQIPETAAESFDFRGVTYRYDNRYRQITAGQFVDLEEKVKQFAEDPAGAYPGVIAILYKPGEHYESEAAERNEALFHDLPMDIILPIRNFFLSREKAFYRTLQAYSQIREFRTPTGKPSGSSPERGAGLRRLWAFVRRMGGQ